MLCRRTKQMNRLSKLKLNEVFSILIGLYSLSAQLFLNELPFQIYASDHSLIIAAIGTISSIFTAYFCCPKISIVRIFSYNPASPSSLFLIIKILFLIAVFYCIYVLVIHIPGIPFSRGRSASYEYYLSFSVPLMLQKIQTFLVCCSIIYFSMGKPILPIFSFLIIGILDSLYGNRTVLYYFLIMVIMTDSQYHFPKRLKLIVPLILMCLLLRTFFFSGNLIEINSIDLLFAIAGEFIFTSFAFPLAIDVAQDSHIHNPILSALGVGKIWGEQIEWAGDKIVETYKLPIGIACGPFCEIPFFVSDALTIILMCIGFTFLMCLYFQLLAKLPPRFSYPSFLMILFLMRDATRTGFITSFSSLILWSVVTIFFIHTFTKNRITFIM